MKCQAKAKSTQKKCNRWAMKGKKVCYVHGGPTPGGIASPHFKTGRYSKQLPERLAERYQEALRDPELLALDEEISLTDSRIGDLLVRVDTGEAGSVWKQAQIAFVNFRSANTSGDQDKMRAALFDLENILTAGIDDYMAWDEIGRMLEQRRKLVESERKRLMDMEMMITAERTMILIGAVVAIIKEHVTDRKALRKISTDIGQLVSARNVQRVEP